MLLSLHLKMLEILSLFTSGATDVYVDEMWVNSVDPVSSRKTQIIQIIYLLGEQNNLSRPTK